MSYKVIARTVPAVFIVGLLTTLLVGYVHNKWDPFTPYKDFTKGPLSIKPKKLKHYADEEQLIREKLKLDLSHRERVILAGIHWIITFADDDNNFDFLFPDFMLLMQKLTMSENRAHQEEVAKLIVKKSFARAENKLASLFSADEESRWNFIRLFDILARNPEFQNSYFRFYQKHFGPNLRLNYKADGTEFLKAIELADYQILFAYLLQTSFLHYYLAAVKNPSAVLPSDEFPRLLKEFESFNYILDHPVDSPQFRSLGYLATHIVLYLTNYGEFAIKDGTNKRKAQAYIESSFDKVRHQLGDFDLLAEYVQCLKILNPGEDQRINDLEKFLFSLQRPDGSWGSKWDFKTNPYTAIHPGGAALMALNQPNSPVRRNSD